MGLRGHFCWWTHSGLPVGMVVDVEQINSCNKVVLQHQFPFECWCKLIWLKIMELADAPAAHRGELPPGPCILIQAHILSILSQAASSTAAWCCILVKQKNQRHFRVWAFVVLFFLWKLFWTFNWGPCFRIVKDTFLAACLRTIRSMFSWHTSFSDVDSCDGNFQFH